MDKDFLQLVLVITYGPFALMLLAFIAGLALKLGGDSSFLRWLVNSTAAQKPIERNLKSQDH